MDGDHVGNRQKGSSEGKPPPRQACTECRRRKIKCTGQGKHGSCKTCQATGAECVFPESQKRGPQKGYFDTISTRLARIEVQINKLCKSRSSIDDDKDTGSVSEDYPDAKRRKSKGDSRRHSLDRPLPAMAALVAPKLSTAPEISLHNYRPQINLSTPIEALSPEESALGVLAQVAHELEPTATPDYFTDPNILPTDLADSLIQIYFARIHPLFPIVHEKAFRDAYHQMTSGVILPDHLAWSVFLSASQFSNDPRLHSGAYSRLQIEKALKLSTDRDLNTGQSTDLSLIQALILSQLFPAWRERKVALLSWTINGRAIKLAFRRQLNCNPAELGIHDGRTARARIKTWWCVYMVDIWDAARRGRPPSIHEPDTNVPLPDIDQDTAEERFFLHLVQVTRILAQVLSFSFNNCKSAATLQSPDTTTEEAVRAFRTQLSEWFRTQTPLPPLLQSNLQIAYLTICILLHRPLLPNPLATAYADPIVLLLTKCATQIVHLANQNGTNDAGSVPWRLFVPAVGYLTAGVTLAQNAAWSTHVQGAQPLRLAAQFEIMRLLDVFEKADVRGYSTAGMSSLLRSIFQRGGIALTPPPPDVRPEIELGVPLPHEDPSFSIVHSRVLAEKALSEKRSSGSVLHPIAPSSSESSLVRKRKFDTVGSSHSSSGRGAPQPLPSLANLTGLDTGRRSPTSRSVHSHSTYSSHSSTSQSRLAQLYPHSSVPPKMPVSTAYHPTYGTAVDVRHGSRQWEQKGLMSPPPSLPPLYDRRHQDPAAPKHNFPPEREFNALPQQSYNRRDSEYYQRPISPTTRTPYPPLQQPPDPMTFHSRHPPPIDPRYARTSTPPSSVASGGTVQGWPPGYPYASPQSATYRYDHPPPASLAPSPRVIAGPSGPQRYNEYYYPPPRE